MSIKSEVTRINNQVSNQKSNLSTITSQLNSKLGLSVSSGSQGTPLEKNSTTLTNIKNALNNYVPSINQGFQILDATDYSIDLQGTPAEILFVMRIEPATIICYNDNQWGTSEITPYCQGSTMNLTNSCIVGLEGQAVYLYDWKNNPGYFDCPGPAYSGKCLMIIYE